MKKIFVIYSAALVIILFIISTIAFSEYRQTKEQYLKNFNETQLLLAKQTALSLEREMEKLYGMIDVLANIPPIRKLNVESSFAAFKRYYQKVKGFECLAFFDDQKKFIFGYPESSQKFCMQNVKKMKNDFDKVIQTIIKNKEPTIFYPHTNEESRSMIYILAPVFNEKNVYIGTIIGAIHIDILLKRSINPLFQKNSGYIWIMDTTGVLIFHPIHQEMVMRNIFKRDSSCLNCHYKSSIEYAMTSQENGVATKKNKSYPRQLVGYAHAHLYNLTWVVVVSSKYKKVSQAINKQLTYFLLLLIITVGVLLSGSYWIYRVLYSMMKMENEKKFLEKEKNLLMEQQKLNRKLSLLIEQSPDPIFIANKNRIIQVNKAFEILMKYSQSDISEKEISLKKLCVHSENKKKSDEFNQWLHSSRDNIRFETKIQTAHGEILEVIMSLSKIQINGEIQIQGVIHDITRIKQLEKEKLEKEHLAVLGSMAARLAHEIKNPLASLQAGIQFLESEFAKDDNKKLYFERLKQEITRVDKILKDMLQFARNEEYHFKTIRIIPIVQKIIEISKPLLNQREIQVQIKNRLKEDDFIYADEEKIQQLIWNILNNAIQASSRGGKIECTFSLHNQYVVLSIRDYGKGIPEEIRSQLFTPFKSSKTYGTGLGLVIVKKIVEKHNGKIEISSDDSGTNVSIYLLRKKK